MKRDTNNRILVPLDFSEISETALVHAISIAKKYNNGVTLLHVTEVGALGKLFTTDSQLNDVKKLIEEKLKNKVTETKLISGLDVDFLILEGKPYKTIAATANNNSYDSIIMGSNGASGIGQIVGSNASKTIQLATVPVVVVKSNELKSTGYEKIIMPIDFTVETRQKTEWAIHIAKPFSSTIYLIYEESEDEYIKNRVKGNIKNVTIKFDENNIKYELVSVTDSIATNFATETLNKANELKADLILVMTHTEKSLGEFIIGSLTQQLVNKSEHIPVMCIHPKETGFIFDY